MTHLEDKFTGLYDTEIYYQAWVPDGDIRAVLIVVHGFGEHSGRYTNVVDALKDEGIAIYALDHRGHGKSGGKQVYVNRFTDYLADLSTFEGIVREKHPDTPFFLLGHSMGSIISNHYMSQHPDQSKFKSIILSGTGADFGPGISKVTIILAKILSALAPKMSIPSNLDPNFISHDEAVIQAYIDDPLVHHDKITARLGAEMMAYTSNMKDAASKITIPALIQIGFEDDTFAPESRQILCDAINTEDKLLKVYEGDRHEVYNEVDKEVALNDLKDWINKFL